MHFRNEAALRDFIAEVVNGTTEYTLSRANRIDIISDRYFIEVKPYLTPSAMDKAGGQITRYSAYAGNRKLVIAGCTPDDFSTTVRKRAEAYRHVGIHVWFIDQMPSFQDEYKIKHQKRIKKPAIKPIKKDTSSSVNTITPQKKGFYEKWSMLPTWCKTFVYAAGILATALIVTEVVTPGVLFEPRISDHYYEQTYPNSGD